MSLPWDNQQERPGVIGVTPAMGTTLVGGHSVDKGTCSVVVCERPARSRGGLCNSHHQWSFKNGGATPSHAIRPHLDPAEMLRRKTILDSVTGCLNWTGHIDPRGYGRSIDVTTGERRAHRVAWTVHRGPIPDGLTIDHLCRNKACVNVEHLEVVTRSENSRRAVGTRRSHCPTCSCARGES